MGSQDYVIKSAHPPASPVRRNLRMLDSGTVNSDGGQAAALFVIYYWLFVIGGIDSFATPIRITDNQ